MEIICPQCEHPNPKDAKFCKECGLRLARSTDPLIGQQIGNHRLVKRIGVGGMGVVYLAEHVNLGKKYAVKFLHPQFASDEEVVERFRREAQVIAGLDHENIIRENDFGWLDGVGFYLIMEYLQGETLKDRLKEQGALPVENIIQMFDQLMDALDEAHSQSVIHRDLKPENLFLVMRREREQLKILDFGIARVVLDGAHKDVTVDGEVYGSPTYMSPEQARGEISKVDHRSDLYAMGVILVEVLTGRPPYKGATPAEVMLAHISGLPPRLSDLNPDLRYAEGLEDFVLKALAKESDERFQSANEFWSTLLPMLERTQELRTDIDETVDIPPHVAATSALLSSTSSARVLVSREWTPTPSNRSTFQPGEPSLHAPASQASLPSVAIPLPTVDAKNEPSPTSEMEGFKGVLPSEIGEDAPTTGLAPEDVLHFQAKHHEPTPQPLSHTPSPLLPPSADAASKKPSYEEYAMMTSFDDESDDDEPTTVSFHASAVPEERKEQAGSFGNVSSHVVSSDVFPIDVLDDEDKTTSIAVNQDSSPPPVGVMPPPIRGVGHSLPHQAGALPSVASSPRPLSPHSIGSNPPSAPFMHAMQDEEIEFPKPVWLSVMKHPAFSGGVVGFILLIAIWMFVSSNHKPENTIDSGQSVVLRGSAPQLPPRAVVKRKVNPTRRSRTSVRTMQPSKAVQPRTVELVQFTIQSEPSGATVIIQGRGKVGVTPYHLRSPKGSYLHIYIQKEGYQSKILPWRADKDIQQIFKLIPGN